MKTIQQQIVKQARKFDREQRGLRRNKLQCAVMATALMQAAIERGEIREPLSATFEAYDNAQNEARAKLELGLKLTTEEVDLIGGGRITQYASYGEGKPGRVPYDLRHADGDEAPGQRHYCEEMALAEEDAERDDLEHDSDAYQRALSLHRSAILRDEVDGMRYVDPQD